MVCHYDHFSALMQDRPEYDQTVPQYNSYLSDFPPHPVSQKTKHILLSKPDMTEVELWVESESRRRGHWQKYLKQSRRVSFNDSVRCYSDQCQDQNESLSNCTPGITNETTSILDTQDILRRATIHRDIINHSHVSIEKLE